MKYKKKKELRCLSLTDWMILLFVFLFIIMGAFYLWRAYGQSLEDVPFHYRLLISGADVKLFENGGLERLIPMGSSVRSENGTALLGSVLSVRLLESVRPVVIEESVQFVQDPGLCDVEIVVAANGKTKEGDGLRVSDIRIAAGMRSVFRMGSYYGTATVIYVSEEERQ